MSSAFIVTGGLGDSLLGLCAPTHWQMHNDEPIKIYVNSHQEICDFVEKCTYFDAEMCPARTGGFPDPENPLNLPPEFLDQLHKEHEHVWSSFPDSLGQAPFGFPWFQYVRSYKEYMRTKVSLRCGTVKSPAQTKKHIFLHMTSVTLEKNYSLTKLQTLVNIFNQTNYEVVIARTSQWKGTPLPFFCTGKYIDLVDQPIERICMEIRDSDYFVGIDSSMAHIAYHIGIPRIVLQQHHNSPFHLVRYHEDVCDDMSLESSPEQIANRVLLNLKDPLTENIPAYLSIPANVSTKQLLYKKYYD